MPFSRPTLTALRNQVAQELNANLPGADALLRFSNLRVLGDIQAGLAHMQYGYLDWIALQATPFTATDEFLEAWGALRGVLRKSASQSSGLVTFTGTEGIPVNTGTGLKRSDGLPYTVTAAAAVEAGKVTVAATANPDPAGLAGLNGDCAAGTQFTLASAIPGIDSTGVAATAFRGGADIESNDAYRARVLFVYQNPPQGGAASDYVAWALAVPGVTRAWCTGNGYGAGTVIVFVMLDEANAQHDGFPQGTDGVASAETRDTSATGDQLTVANAIYPLRPVTALVYVVAPMPYPVDISIRGVALDRQDDALAAIDALMKSEGEPGGFLILAHLWSAIAAVSGVNDFLILSPTDDVMLPPGTLAVPGVVTWS
ncbi:baseplate J/gp47 family protein [Paraburkholderia sp. UCT2]|uniref:baseplate J/gp47 family protein n=1 Tax=Paraburkholderia sp. UCT2 TaxID=2615208 RepID=UPI001655F2C3|nr:baseplate J/gp47 family protein [Paraburkholderia sp. UCT2]MBC8729454.1 baseplate J/gp47 family protein [Paraburkholderia sp. UCT2]